MAKSFQSSSPLLPLLSSSPSGCSLSLLSPLMSPACCSSLHMGTSPISSSTRRLPPALPAALRAPLPAPPESAQSQAMRRSLELLPHPAFLVVCTAVVAPLASIKFRLEVPGVFRFSELGHAPALQRLPALLSGLLAHLGLPRWRLGAERLITVPPVKGRNHHQQTVREKPASFPEFGVTVNCILCLRSQISNYGVIQQP